MLRHVYVRSRVVLGATGPRRTAVSGGVLLQMTNMNLTSHDGLALGTKRYSNASAGLRTVSFQGLPVKIEIEVGETRSGTGEDGRPWEKTYEIPYGEIPQSRTLADGDGVDIYLGPDPLAPMIYVVHQLRRDGSYDEDKCLLGFRSIGEAIQAYKSHGPSWGFGSVDTMTVDQFKHGYLASNRKHR